MIEVFCSENTGSRQGCKKTMQEMQFTLEGLDFSIGRSGVLAHREGGQHQVHRLGDVSLFGVGRTEQIIKF